MFQLLHQFRLHDYFEFFNFNRFFYPELLFKCVNDSYFRFQEVKIYQIDYFTWKNGFICKKWYFGGHFAFFDPGFLPEVDDVENWVTIPNLVMKNTTHIPNYKNIGLKLWSWQCARFHEKYGGHDVINYVNELKHKRAPLDIQRTIFGKFYWNWPSSFAIPARTHTQTHTQTNRQTTRYFRTWTIQIHSVNEKTECNNEEYYWHIKLIDNWIKTVDVTVLAIFLMKIAAMTSLIMLISWNSNEHN